MLDNAGPDVSRPFIPDYICLETHRGKGRTGRSAVLPKTFLFREGERAGSLYRVEEGCVALSQLLADGRRQIIDILGPGRLFGMSALAVHLASAEMLSHGLIERLDETHVDPAEIGANLRLMLGRSQFHATLLGRKTASEKVASAILDLSGQFVRRAAMRRSLRTTFTLFLTRADLADWLGLTVETVSRCLNSLKRAGILDFRHPEIITICNQKALADMAGAIGHFSLAANAIQGLRA